MRKLSLIFRDARLGVPLLTDVWRAMAEAVLQVSSFGEHLVVQLMQYGRPCAFVVLLHVGRPSCDVAAAGKISDPAKTPTRTLLFVCSVCILRFIRWALI